MLTLSDVLAGMGGDIYRWSEGAWAKGLLQPNELTRPIADVVVDSRTASPGSMFVALPGATSHGDEHVSDAVLKGAAGAVVSPGFLGSASESRLNTKVMTRGPGGYTTPWVIAVPDTLKALQRLAEFRRNQFSGTVIGVTGSVGKTSIKEAIAHVLEGEWEGRVLKSRENLNTEIGLPLELLRMKAHDRVAVLEMGMYQPGDIALLAAIAKPDIGVVANVRANHLERTGSIERTARGKAELVHGLSRDGIAVLNTADPMVRAMVPAARGRVVTFAAGFDDYSLTADFAVAAVSSHGRRGFEGEIVHGGRRHAFVCPAVGAHNAFNLLPAAAIGHHMGLGWDVIVHSISGFHSTGRAQFLQGLNGTTLLDDRYNASADSVLAALRLLREEPGRHLAILGEMYELGPEEERHHRIVGHASSGLDGLILVGPKTRWIAEEAMASGLPQEKIVQVQATVEAANAAISWMREGDVVLIKGSRGLHLEDVVNRLRSPGIESEEAE